MKSKKKINNFLEKEIKRTLTWILAEIKDPNKMQKFLEDFLTSKEYTTLSKRLAIFYWLKKGRSYTNIQENLKVSTATIAKAQEKAQNKGIIEALKLLEAEEWAQKVTQKIKKIFSSKR